MTREARLWTLAAVTSLGLHGALGALTLALLPARLDRAAPETIVTIEAGVRLQPGIAPMAEPIAALRPEVAATARSNSLPVRDIPPAPVSAPEAGAESRMSATTASRTNALSPVPSTLAVPRLRPKVAFPKAVDRSDKSGAAVPAVSPAPTTARHSAIAAAPPVSDRDQLAPTAKAAPPVEASRATIADQTARPTPARASAPAFSEPIAPVRAAGEPTVPTTARRDTPSSEPAALAAAAPLVPPASIKMPKVEGRYAPVAGTSPDPASARIVSPSAPLPVFPGLADAATIAVARVRDRPVEAPSSQPSALLTATTGQGSQGGLPARAASGAGGTNHPALPSKTTVPPLSSRAHETIAGTVEATASLAALQNPAPSGPNDDPDLAPGLSPATIAELVAAYRGGDCFAALTEATGTSGTYRVTALSNDADELEDFAKTLARQAAGQAPQRIVLDEGLVRPPQCRALAFLTNMRGSSAFSLRLRLDTRRMTSGDTLSGIVEGIASDATLDLLLVDDEGLVQQISPFLKRDGPAASFALPLSLSGPDVATAQILIALALPKALIHAEDTDGAPADEFFEALGKVLADKGLDGEFAVDHFTIRSR